MSSARHITLAAIAGVFMFGGGYSLYEHAITRFAPAVAAADKAEQAPIKILVVPGHTNENPGAVYKDIRESDLNLALSYYLRDELARDESIEALVTRERGGLFAGWFAKYVSADYFAIMRVANARRTENAAEAGALSLYAVNKFAAENDVDLVLHVHFNNYPGRKDDDAGKYRGFAIYIPAATSPSYKQSRVFAEILKRELLVYQSPSNLPVESGGIVESDDLVALAPSTAGLDGDSVNPVALVEYGYIYEPRLEDAETREKVLKLFASATVAGIEKYFASYSK